VKIKSQKDFFSGLLYTLVGAAFAYGATSYNIGTGARMGPGYFPLLLGGLPSIKLPAMGLIVAIYGTTLVVSMAGDKFKLQEVLILATVLSVMSYLAFIMLLKLQFPVWPTFISG